MAKLHQILAVDTQVKARAETVTKGVRENFLHPAIFSGMEKTYQPYDDSQLDDAEVNSEKKNVGAVVAEELEKLLCARGESWDLEIQKDLSNANARADVEVDGEILVKNAPATWLLYMERELKCVLESVKMIPTRSPSTEWTESEAGHGIVRTKNPVSRYRTQKKTEWKVVVEATPQHAAQVKEITADVPVGVFREVQYTSMPSEKEKSALVARVEKILAAVKIARAKANEAEVVTENPSAKIIAWIQK